MANSGKGRTPHWTESSEVLRQAEKIRTAPTNSKPAEVPTHVEKSLFSKEVPIGKGGTYARFDGPNGEFGAEKTPDGGFKAGAQLNAGGVALGHRNKDHDVSVGLSYGKGGGVQVHGGAMPGVSFSAGPVTATARHTALAQPVDPETAKMAFLFGGQ